MPIRLFTSGSHKAKAGTFTYSNEDIDRIFSATQDGELTKIPFVLGHPENDLPVIGYLPKTALQKYTEGDKVSIGFDRPDADLSEDSMNVIRQMKSNKISVRVRDGEIKHIGLVTKAAVAENNSQDFSQENLTGDFSAGADILHEEQTTKTPQWVQDFSAKMESIFKPNNMEKETKKPNQQTVDLAGQVESLTQTVNTLASAVSGFVKTNQVNADFAAEDFKHLSAEQKQQAASIAVDLGEEKTTAFKLLLKGLAKAPVEVVNRSVTKDFGNDDPGVKTAGDIIREQMGGGQ